MITLTIDGRVIETEENATILQVARQNHIDIPTLCHHDALEPYGACRLCTVEIKVGKRRRFVTACNYTIRDNMDIKTGSPEVIELRKTIIELLLARCPEVDVIKKLARSYGIARPRFRLDQQTCILCGLCVRVCKEIIGASAISLVNRGSDAIIDTPYHQSSEVCTGCGTCASVCPTGMIQLVHTIDRVEIRPFNTTAALQQCVSCGRGLATQAQLDSVSKRLGRLKGSVLLCVDCKKQKGSLALANSTRRSQLD